MIVSLLSWLARSVRVSREEVHELVDRCDMDADGYISIGELHAMIREWVGMVKK